MNNSYKSKGISLIISASIILATIVTIITTLQAFVIPELLKERSFNHSQEVMRGLQELYVKKSSVIPLSYFGIPFFVPISFDGMLRYTSKPELMIEVFNMTEPRYIEKWLDSSSIIEVEELKEIYLYCQAANSGLIANITIIKDGLRITLYLTSENFYINVINMTDSQPTDYAIRMIRFRLKIMNLITRTYNYTISYGDSLILNLMNPIYNLSQFYTKSKLYYITNSPKLQLYLKYLKQENLNKNFKIKGAITYQSSGYQLSYLVTPWGLITFNGGNSSISTSPQIFWMNEILIINLLNITWGKGLIGGVGSVKINLIEESDVIIISKFSKLTLNFTYISNIKNAHAQLIDILGSNTPQNINKVIQKGDEWIAITFEGDGKFKILISNVNTILN